ncbi:TPA: hypothetical protein OTY28_006153, partial [Pseudomonas aeruginosa]|nr:hypothetical protein [Pseudomonas aeruginosa]
ALDGGLDSTSGKHNILRGSDNDRTQHMGLVGKGMGRFWKWKTVMPSIGRLVHQAMVGGSRVAPLTPIYGLIAWAMADYESLRQFLSTADNATMSQAVLLLLIVGFALGAVLNAGMGAVKPGLVEQGAYAERLLRRDAEVWYWAQKPDGSELAIREVTTARCSPNADVRWAIDDLIKELERPENRAGSDLLDHKVMKLLSIQSLELKPTQRLEDARSLLSLRYRGMQSRYEWEARTEVVRQALVKAFVTVRVPAKAPAMEPAPWRRCLVAEGPSEALAITIAAISRETWTFTT